MKNDLENIHYSPIREYNYARRFREYYPNDKNLNFFQRLSFISLANRSIAVNSKGLPLINDILESTNNNQDEYSTTERAIVSVMLFVDMTLVDSMVAGKYFIKADKEYDKQFMRGKLKVILNEGFKRLYGFDERTRKKSEWIKLQTLMNKFPPIINRQYLELTSLLDLFSKSSTWWKEERDIETHMDAEKLYASRQKVIIESQVMMGSAKLINVLLAVNDFLTNVHGCLHNSAIKAMKQALHHNNSSYWLNPLTSSSFKSGS